MSNNEKWDHSGFDGLQKETNNMNINNHKRQMNKKGYYKSKESSNSNFNEKTMISDYIEHPMRKNPIKKYSGYQNKYMPNEGDWITDKDWQASKDNSSNQLSNSNNISMAENTP